MNPYLERPASYVRNSQRTCKLISALGFLGMAVIVILLFCELASKSDAIESAKVKILNNCPKP